MNLPNSHMQNIKKIRASSILKEKHRTISKGKSNIPKPVRIPTAIIKIRPTKKAFIFFILLYPHIGQSFGFISS